MIFSIKKICMYESRIRIQNTQCIIIQNTELKYQYAVQYELYAVWRSPYGYSRPSCEPPLGSGGR